MNITQFTKSFDACVGHARKIVKTENYKGVEIKIEQIDSDFVWLAKVFGGSQYVPYPSADAALKAAKAVIDRA